MNEIQSTVERLENKAWWLRFQTIIVILLLVGAIFSLSFPAESELNAGPYAGGLMGLLLLFALFAFYQQARMTRLRRQLAKYLSESDALEDRAEELEKLAVRDALTGLYNRRLAEERLGEEVCRAERAKRPLTVLMIDLDRFKQINDGYGHAAGDLILQECAAHLRKATRSSDVAARLGGDEFLVLLPECSSAHVKNVLVHLGPFEVNFKGQTIPVAFSIGSAEFKPPESPERLLERADQNLYEIKRRRKEAAKISLAAPASAATVRKDWSPHPSTSPSKGRRTERIMLEIPIRVLSFGGAAGGFSEDTRTILVNRHGGLIALRHPVAQDEIIRIINLENLREDDFRVAGLSRQDGPDYAEWGVECLDKNRSLWEIDFPPPLEVNDAKGGALLQCEACGKQSFMVLSLTEVGTLDSDGAIEKFCEKCGELKRWAYTEEIRVPKIPVPALDHVSNAPISESAPSTMPVQNEPVESGPPVEAPPTSQLTNPPPSGQLSASRPSAERAPAEATSPPPQVGDKKKERRVHRRLTLKLPALVRNQVGETELAMTENISKGGLGVGLTMKLSLGERVSVICPYSGSEQEIEQKAEVKRCLSLYGGQKWFYGFCYMTR
jgi:diguanylate cyclase (GGDEF)-like protein